MATYRNIVIGENERGLLYRDGRLERVLMPGRHRFVSLFQRLTVERFDLTAARFGHRFGRVLYDAHRALLDPHLREVSTGADTLALVRARGELIDLVPPHSHRLYWRAPVAVDVETIPLGEDLAIAEPLRRELAASGDGGLLARWVHSGEVPDRHTGLLFVDGRFRDTLPAGSYAFWQVAHEVKVALVDTRLRSMEVSGQEILSRDKVSLRVNLSAVWRVSDPVTAWRSSDDYRGQLYRELQFALREAVGTRTLDALLADRSQLDGVIRDRVAPRAAAMGIELASVGLKDIILPGEMKAILNQVVEAEKAAQANVIRRREETAATRSALNTAKLMESNPTLMRLKELEALEKVAEKVERLTVFSGLEGVMRDTVRIDA